MKKSVTKLFSVLVFFGSMAAVSCSDSTSVDPGDPPEIPETIPVEIDRSLFEESDPPAEEESVLFYEAEAVVNTANFSLTMISGSGNAYLNFIQNREPAYDDGVWEWKFSSDNSDDDLQVRVTAEPLNGAVEWNMYVSGFISGVGVSEEEYLFASGTVSETGDSGTWSYFSPESETDPIYLYEWDISSEMEYKVTATYGHEDEQFFIEYIREENNNWLEFKENGETGYVIFWDAETGEGFLDDGDGQRCWGADFSETAC